MSTNDLSVIIPTAGVGRRMRSYGPRALVGLWEGRTIIRRQIDLVRAVYPKSDIIVVVGHEADKVLKTLPSYVRVVENEHFETTGAARSITLGLRATTTKRVLVVYGDLVFNKSTIESVPVNKSSILVDNRNKTNISSIGVTLDGAHAVHFEYGLPTKWCHIVTLVNKELELFKSIGGKKERRKHMSHEIFNEIIERGGDFHWFENKKMLLAEIDSIQDVKKAEKAFK